MAIFILTVGILTVMVMQVRAINASSSAMNRTEANSVAIAFLETVKEIPFDDALLNRTGASPGSLANDANARTFTVANFQNLPMLSLVQVGAAAGTVVDRSGITYRLSWAVQDNFLATGEILNKRIRVFMTWNTLMGNNRLEMTTIKYNNISL